LESGDFEIWSRWHVGKWSTNIIIFSNAYYCHVHVHSSEIPWSLELWSLMQSKLVPYHVSSYNQRFSISIIMSL
jgi:hypothetical protein